MYEDKYLQNKLFLLYFYARPFAYLLFCLKKHPLKTNDREAQYDKNEQQTGIISSDRSRTL